MHSLADARGKVRVHTLHTWVTAAVAAVLLAIPSSAGAVERGVDVDLTWGIPSADVAPTQAAITDIGAEWVRLTMHWHDAEPSDNSYSAQTLSEWDAAVAEAEATGAKIVAVVGRSPKWASGSNDEYMPPQDPADYADFISFIANRYEGRVAAWEIWNEENSTRFWPSGPDAAEYTRLLQAAYPAVKAADPTALVAFGGLAYSDYKYVAQAYAAGAKGYFDVMVSHPYTDGASPESVWYDGTKIHMRAFTAYREIREVMLANGDDKPMWFTEFGWATTTAAKGVSAALQASYLTRAFCMMEQDPYVQVALWYNLRNNHWNDDADSWETQLGLMKTTFEWKPAYSAFKDYDPSACPAPAPEPDATPEPEPAPTEQGTEDPPADEGELGDVSTIRSRTTTLLRFGDRARAAGSSRVLDVRARRLTLRGRVKGAHSGRVTLRVRHRRPGTKSAVFGSTQPKVVKAMHVGRDGRFRFGLRLRGRGKWRVRAVYVGDSDAYPSRSRLLRFRV